MQNQASFSGSKMIKLKPTMKAAFFLLLGAALSANMSVVGDNVAAEMSTDVSSDVSADENVKPSSSSNISKESLPQGNMSIPEETGRDKISAQNSSNIDLTTAPPQNFTSDDVTEAAKISRATDDLIPGKMTTAEANLCSLSDCPKKPDADEAGFCESALVYLDCAEAVLKRPGCKIGKAGVDVMAISTILEVNKTYEKMCIKSTPGKGPTEAATSKTPQIISFACDTKKCKNPKDSTDVPGFCKLCEVYYKCVERDILNNSECNYVIKKNMQSKMALSKIKYNKLCVQSSKNNTTPATEPKAAKSNSHGIYPSWKAVVAGALLPFIAFESLRADA